MSLEELNKEMDELLGARYKLEWAAASGDDLRAPLIEFNQQLIRLQRSAEAFYKKENDRRGQGNRANAGAGNNRPSPPQPQTQASST